MLTYIKEKSLILFSSMFLLFSLVFTFSAKASGMCESCGGPIGNQHCYDVNHGNMDCSQGWNGECNNIGPECSNGGEY